jgi:transposase
MAGRKPYPDEFRVLLVEQVEAGSSRRAAGQRLRVSPATAVRWAQHKARTGRADRGAAKRPPRSPLEAQTAWLLELVAQEPDLTLDQIVVRIAEARQVKTSRSALDRFFHRHGISFKKKPAGGRADASGRGGRSRAMAGGAAKPRA